MNKINAKEFLFGGGENRDSSIELFRIITMLCIVAHHYVVNSGIINEITQSNVLTGNALFALLFGWGGKTGINCFVLITGYFMCCSDISLKKFLKLFLAIEFYNIFFYIVFLLSGFSTFYIGLLIRAILPVYAGDIASFNIAYLIFFLFIPYLNILIKNMDERQHINLILLCLVVESALQTFLRMTNAFTYVGWFMVLYIIAAYIRIYPKEIFGKRKLWGIILLAFLAFSWLSVILGAYFFHITGKAYYYYFVADSNKILALVTAICAFLYFKNLRLKYHPFINKIAASTFGVLLIHANSDTMRQWLWRNTLQNATAFHSAYFVVHAIGSVLIVYCVCTVIDMMRIKFLEKPFFTWYDRKKG